MIKLLPFIVIPILIVIGLGYWRYIVANRNLTTSQTTTEQTQKLMEVPKTLPNATLEDRVKALEDTNQKLVTQLNAIKTLSSQGPSASSLDSRLITVESSVTDLKARVSSLEKTSPSPAAAATGTKYPLYIPMGADGGPWIDKTWTTLTEYQVAINPDDYPGYSGMQLEVNSRLSEPGGTGSVRLYNVTDGVSVSSQADTTSTAFGLHSTSSFKLSSGTRTYTIQVQSSVEKNFFVQSARIKVNF